jgi:indole-3-glycerol phosphate synthase
VTVFDRILDRKREEVSERRRVTPLEALRDHARSVSAPRGFGASLRERTGRPRIIAEVKKASPSKGVIRAHFDPVEIARAYEAAGAAAISVLTDEPFFQGKLEDLEAVRKAVALPVLRKDFLVDRYQVWEARACGADALLLILAALPDDGLVADLAGEILSLGMDILWEVHDEEDLRRALTHAPDIVGVNNRNLRTFEVALETTRKLIPWIPEGAVAVSESGFFERKEIDRMLSWGVGAFLIGESLLRAEDPGAALRTLLGSGTEVGRETGR